MKHNEVLFEQLKYSVSQKAKFKHHESSIKKTVLFVLPGHRWQSITRIIHFAAHSEKYLYLTRRQ